MFRSGASCVCFLLAALAALVPGALARAGQWPSNAAVVPSSAACRANCPTTGSPEIQGEVLFPDGSPAANIPVKLEPEMGGGMMATAVTDSGGEFYFTDVGVGNSFMLSLDVPGYQPVRRSVTTNAMVNSEDIILAPLRGTKEPNNGAIVSVAHLRVPPKAMAQYRNGLLQLGRGRTDAAEKSFRQAIHFYPDFAMSYMKLSAIYADQRRFPQADRAIQRALRLGHSSSEAFGYLGYVYARENHPKKAVQAFHRSIALRKTNWFAQLELGRLLYSRKKFRRALPHFMAARRIHPQFASAHLLLYDDLIQLGERNKALTELDDFLTRFPNSRETPQLRKVRAALAAAIARRQ
jgi:Flp pilus assembly protein TadD